jgi:hypothetical protein
MIALTISKWLKGSESVYGGMGNSTNNKGGPLSLYSWLNSSCQQQRYILLVPKDVRLSKKLEARLIFGMTADKQRINSGEFI